MKLLVTGASGFLGQYTVAEALRRGFQVRAVVRQTSNENLPWCNHPGLELVRVDLQEQKLDNIVAALQGVNVVLHIAGTTKGDFATQYASNVVVTENLLKAMVVSGVLRLVAISSFAVFDYLRIKSGETITEDSPIECEPPVRDVYAQTKLMQEEIVRDFEAKYCGKVTILRLGMIYGRGHLWNALVGAKVSDRFWIRIGAKAEMPLVYVENCAEAIVTAAECDAAIGQTLNIVDNDLPTQDVYAQKLAKIIPNSPSTITISWTVMRLMARSICLCNQLLLAGKIQLPHILIPARLHARFKPLHYSNTRAQQVLHWKPKYSLVTALERSCSDAGLLHV
ncbi:NAD-dependent epimerase/dehydratase family protein [Fischerella thermalis]|jgi:nucleoside-diphosphate-sugar epimerase|uniref:NAD-dependent epimerase/dehydratase n=2 Tax=Fischerella TaxID=1190 RepID=G6FP84_9CYAN|nr:NAD(P)-dependent oxidoreductase [Fischerella thermalis]PMB09344.1 NAD(P)-dependent oxidoreductase [Fischerella thermalis CCMEE 5273]PMB11117.1 NAD(P)-dependent oxidoreductase [Fischerella thermalis CCMEE 5328]EHC18684.1 NAD-dependent epimerase/dehydratase [Fischerella thermalis JSC-11]PLZ13282.1 NAD(P)-dependent oxidoreductase [Fischerella thermalis WC1110]PLZ23673.1 NAD(P)-dependent oxidoreductase [Fischerella thermalis WC341]